MLGQFNGSPIDSLQCGTCNGLKLARFLSLKIKIGSGSDCNVLIIPRQQFPFTTRNAKCKLCE